MAVLFDNQQSVSVSQVYKSSFTAHSSSPFLSQGLKCPIEVSFTDEQQAQLAYFLRILKQANQQNRWIMFIGEDALIDKALLQNAGIDLNKVLVLKNKKGLSDPLLMEKALESGNCSAVIACGDIEHFTNNNVREAAQNGASYAFVINRHNTPQMTIH